MISVMITHQLLNAKFLTTEMIPEEEYHSLKETYKLLCHIIDPQKMPRLPSELREAAKKCLRNYPVRRTFEELMESVDFYNPR